MSGTETKKRVFLSVFLFLLCASSWCRGQSLRDHLAKADRYYDRKDYQNALAGYLDALGIDPNDALTNFKTGISYLNQGNSSQAVVYLEKAFALDSAVDPFIHFHLGVAFQGAYKFSEARRHFEIFRAGNKKMAGVATEKIRQCIAADTLMRKPPKAKVVRLGPEINSPFAEHSPLLSPDRKTLIFTSTRSPDSYEVKSGTNYEDVYISHWSGKGWSVPQKISPNINVRYNEAAVSLSPDGKTLFLYYEEGKGDIYTSRLENGEWTKPEPLNAFINHPLYRETTACLSADGQRLYFASDRPGGKGGLDIYVSRKTPGGDWGRPTNLGSPINTRGNEDSPFPADSGATLYFSSDGHPGLGGNDIFRSRLVNGKWTVPENLGYPVNSTGYDGFFILADSTTGYYSAHPGTTASNTDIFVATFLPPPVEHTARKADTLKAGPSNEAKAMATLSGHVTDAATGEPLAADITLVNNETKTIVATAVADSAGYFAIDIRAKGNYGVTTRRKGYLFHSMNLDLPSDTAYQEIRRDITMARAVVGSRIVLKNVFFDINESTPRAESIPELENIREILADNPEWRVEISGHTDNVGNREDNLALSLKRAQSVVDYLIAHGISAKRLEAKGYGSDRPLVSNDDEKEGRQINRRTEIEIIR